MHKELNEYRAEHRSQKLEISDTLNYFAQNWAETMYETGEYKHSDPSKGERPFSSGENILWGNDYSPAQLISKKKAHWTLYHWKNSPGHNKNLIYYEYNQVGYGFYKGYAVQILNVFKEPDTNSWYKAFE